MSDLPELDVLDTDGALRELAEADAVAGLDRGAFLRKGVVTGGAVFAGGTFFAQYLGTAEARIARKRSKRNDVKVLNFALTFEHLEAAFYAQALANGAYGDNADLKKFAEIVAKHEAKHVAFLKRAIGRGAVKAPRFDFGAAVTDKGKFAATAQVLEEAGVSGYLGQIDKLLAAPTQRAIGTIATVEARHAAWIRFIRGDTPAVAALDTGDTLSFVTAVGTVVEAR